ncbi:flavoprotein [Rathayibacter festucae]|uniref:Flavoprotein domain-containing protein n=1 Tax=Rathayibacter festucae DSM 15932 TaxID=1328866 RepID=A0A3T0T0T7_9MICO|nr:flavoprotein [Rathayibacter festucae]AZZ52256.1 hypothetical protein C1I64_09460 [Rathayibacter festucae DSM 15932]
MASVDRLLLGMSGSPAVLSVLPVLAAARGSLVGSYSVVMTPSACRLVSPTTVGSLLHAEVFVETFALTRGEPPHRWLASHCDAALVAPATATTLSALAHGSTGTLLTLTLANVNAPVGLVPALNEDMLARPAIQRCLTLLESDGFVFVSEEPGAATDLTGRAQAGVSKHGLCRLIVQLGRLASVQEDHD